MTNLHRQVIGRKLGAIGYTITEILEGNGLFADLAANAPDDGLVVEVKARREDIERAQQFPAGGIPGIPI